MCTKEQNVSWTRMSEMQQMTDCVLLRQVTVVQKSCSSGVHFYKQGKAVLYVARLE